MGCPTVCILGENLTFTVQAKDGTGAPCAATGAVAYSVYENTTAAAILTGTLSQLASQTGFYAATIACTAANGFERFKTYQIRITATVSAISVAKVYTTLCLGAEDTIVASTGALTSLANVKLYLGITSGDDDILLTSLIARATDDIEKYCDRVLRSASYREIYDGDGDYDLFLRQYPVTAISLLSTDIEEAVEIKNTSTDAYSAITSVDSDSLDLTIYGGTNDGTNSLTLASYTLTTLVAAINAIGKSWTATLLISDFGVWKAAELLPVYGQQCLDEYCEVKIPYDPAYDFEVYEEQGRIHLPTGFPKGRRNVVCKYTAGYSTIPAGLEQIAIDYTNLIYRNRDKDIGLISSESLGDHSISYDTGTKDQINRVKTRLNPYRKINYAI